MTGPLVLDREQIEPHLRVITDGLTPIDLWYGKIVDPPDDTGLSSADLSAAVAMDHGGPGSGSLPFALLWSRLQDAGQRWYVPANPWGQRMTVVVRIFDLSTLEDRALAPLRSVADLEHALRASGAAPTTDQRASISTALSTAATEFRVLSDTVLSGTDVLAMVLSELASFHDLAAASANRLREAAMELGHPGGVMNAGVGATSDALTRVAALLEDWVASEATLQTSLAGLTTAWSTLAAVTAVVAQRVAAAATGDVTSFLNELEVGAALAEWPKVVDLVNALKPGPPASFPGGPWYW